MSCGRVCARLTEGKVVQVQEGQVSHIASNIPTRTLSTLSRRNTRNTRTKHTKHTKHARACSRTLAHTLSPRTSHFAGARVVLGGPGGQSALLAAGGAGHPVAFTSHHYNHNHHHHSPSFTIIHHHSPSFTDIRRHCHQEGNHILTSPTPEVNFTHDS